MKFIIKALLVLTVLALVLGGLGYNLLKTYATNGDGIVVPKPNIQSEHRDITAEVDQIDIDAPIDLVVTMSANPSLELKGDSRLFSKVTTTQSGHVLHISTTGLFITMSQPLKITVGIPHLSALTQRGSGDGNVSGFSGQLINLGIYGSGEMKFVGQYEQLMVQSKGSGAAEITMGNGANAVLDANGSGNLTVIGKSTNVVARATGSGGLDAQRLIAKSVMGEARGSGNIKLYANQTAHINLTGSGDASIFGNPSNRVVKRSGSGEVSWNE